MLQRGHRVICTARELRPLPGAERVELDISAPYSLEFVPEGSLVLHSIPPLEEDNPIALVHALGDRPARMVYLSTTGVYGRQKEVTAATLPEPWHFRDEQRMAAEAAIAAGPWSSMVLRPAAIYGPGRGIHVSMAEGRFRLVDGGDNFVSRIHVDDLAAHAEAALLSEAIGAWPVADEEPCTSLEIAAFCAELLGVPMPAKIPGEEAHHTRRADRRVDGQEVRALLGISLQYPSFRTGIPSSLASSN